MPESAGVTTAQLNRIGCFDRCAFSDQRIETSLDVRQQLLATLFIRQPVPFSRQYQAWSASNSTEEDNAGLHA